MDILEDYLKKSKYWEELHKPTRGLFNVAPMKIVQIIEDYERVKKLNIDVSNRVLLNKMINEMQEVDDEHHLNIACKYLNDC